MSRRPIATYTRWGILRQRSTSSLRGTCSISCPEVGRALDAVCHVLRPGGKLMTPTFCHDETRLSWLVSRLLVTLMGQPMHRRFSAASLRQTLEQRGLRVSRAETIPGLIPIEYVESVLGTAASNGHGATDPWRSDRCESCPVAVRTTDAVIN
jgi:hypothetical protein